VGINDCAVDRMRSSEVIGVYDEASGNFARHLYGAAR
jgi:hypothetical protein